MKLNKLCLATAIAVPWLVSGYAMAEGRTSTGYISSVSATALVMDGITYRFRPNQEEGTPIKVQCAREDNKKMDCEELTQVSQRNRAKAKVEFDGSGYVIRVQILDVLK